MTVEHLREGWLEANRCLCRQLHIIESGKTNAVLSVDERASALQTLYVVTSEFAALLASHPAPDELSDDERAVVEWIESLDSPDPVRAAA